MYNDPLLYCSLKVKRFDVENHLIPTAILTCRTKGLSLPRPLHLSLTIYSVIIIIIITIKITTRTAVKTKTKIIKIG